MPDNTPGRLCIELENRGVSAGPGSKSEERSIWRSASIHAYNGIMDKQQLTVTINGDDAQMLNELAEETGRSYGDLVAEALHCAYDERRRSKLPQQELAPEE